MKAFQNAPRKITGLILPCFFILSECFSPPAFAETDRWRSNPPVIHSSWDDLLDGIESTEDWGVRKNTLKDRYLKLLADSYKPAKPALDLQVHETVVVEDVYIRKAISYQVEVDERAHAYLGIPLGVDGPMPAVVALHGTYPQGADRVAALVDNPEKAYLDHLCRRGYVVIAPEHFVSGRRIPDRGAYDTTAFHEKHPKWTAVGKFTYEHSIAVDVLETWPEVDPDRIGVLGHSLGGHGAFFLAAYDQRIKATAANCSASFFRHNSGVEHWSRDHWYVYFQNIRDGLMAGRLPDIDFHEIIALIAPRAFLDLSAFNDGDPLTQRQRALMNLKIMDVYEREGHPENFAFYMHGKGHSVKHESRELMYAWMDSHLKPESATKVSLLDESEQTTEGEIINLGSRLEPFWDRFLISTLQHARLQMEEPADRGVALVFDRPWEGRFCGYGTVIHEPGVYRMYYRGLPDAGRDGSDLETTCYAESADGIRWVKPNLRIHEVDGGFDNNVILAKQAPYSHNFSPFLDTNPESPGEERYKAVGGIASSGLMGFVSADGIHWRPKQSEAVFKPGGWVLDSQNVAFWSENEGSYLLYFRSAVSGVRAIARSTSGDFVHWTEPEPMIYSDTGSFVPSHHLYTNQTHPYFRAPHVYAATAARFMPGRQVLTDAEAAAVRVHPSYFKDTSDSILMTTRGGNRYDRSLPGALIAPGIGAGNWVSRSNYPLLGLVPTGENEVSLYVNQNYGQPTAHVRRYAFRTDGLAAITGGSEAGFVLTKPIRFTGRKLYLNFSTSAAGSVQVELLDFEGRILPGYSRKESRMMIGNEIKKEVSWGGQSDIAGLEGKPIRLKIHLHEAKLYSMQFDH